MVLTRFVSWSDVRLLMRPWTRRLARSSSWPEETSTSAGRLLRPWFRFTRYRITEKGRRTSVMS